MTRAILPHCAACSQSVIVGHINEHCVAIEAGGFYTYFETLFVEPRTACRNALAVSRLCGSF